MKLFFNCFLNIIYTFILQTNDPKANKAKSKLSVYLSLSKRFLNRDSCTNQLYSRSSTEANLFGRFYCFSNKCNFVLDYNALDKQGKDGTSEG